MWTRASRGDVEFLATDAIVRPHRRGAGGFCRITVNLCICRHAWRGTLSAGRVTNEETMATAVRATIISEIKALLEEEERPIEDLSDDAVLLDVGLDSLGYAILVTRLEDDLGYDPFTLMDEVVYPRTLGEFVEIYERFAPA